MKVIPISPNELSHLRVGNPSQKASIGSHRHEHWLKGRSRNQGPDCDVSAVQTPLKRFNQLGQALSQTPKQAFDMRTKPPNCL